MKVIQMLLNTKVITGTNLFINRMKKLCNHEKNEDCEKTLN